MVVMMLAYVLAWVDLRHQVAVNDIQGDVFKMEV